MTASGLVVLDTFSGAGGFSEGFRQAGFDVVMGMDNWRPACRTHRANGFGECWEVDLLPYGVDEILSLKRYLEGKYGGVDVLIGSPPCTEFSYAKKGGKGDIERGMLLVRRHLLFAALLRPRYWLMENVPRLRWVLDRECERSGDGWEIPYEKLGVPPDRRRELGLEGDSFRIPQGVLLRASDFGACQNRVRFIAGDFPSELLEELKVGGDVSLGGLLERLAAGIREAERTGFVRDPNYPFHRVRLKELRDHFYDTSVHPMCWEEMRHLKRRHIQYGRMDFPEDLSSPARTVMATFNFSSRESLVFDTGRTIWYQGKERPLFRQPTVREVACIQGFPLSFQFKADSIRDRYKLVGNAVPCQMARALALAITTDMAKRLDSLPEGLRERAANTLSRQRANSGKPIIVPPSEVVGEARDAGEIGMRFSAQPSKHIRRKVLSSKLEGDSCVVIWENTEAGEGRAVGGHHWKVCIQRGAGKRYQKVYMDRISVPAILRGMDSTLVSHRLKSLLRRLLSEAERGIPLVDEGWGEFRGWSNYGHGLAHVTGRILRPPSVSDFQRMFTSDCPDTGDLCGPLDFFDGLDAIMVGVFAQGFRDLVTARIRVPPLKDEGWNAGLDRRAVREICGSVPLVTLSCGLLSVHILRRMYRADSEPDTPYSTSLAAADDEIVRFSRMTREVPEP